MKKKAENPLLQAYRHMVTAKAMTELYEANREVTSTYVHATARGHEAIQIALGQALHHQGDVFKHRLLGFNALVDVVLQRFQITFG